MSIRARLPDFDIQGREEVRVHLIAINIRLT